MFEWAPECKEWFLKVRWWIWSPHLGPFDLSDILCVVEAWHQADWTETANYYTGFIFYVLSSTELKMKKINHQDLLWIKILQTTSSIRAKNNSSNERSSVHTDHQSKLVNWWKAVRCKISQWQQQRVCTFEPEIWNTSQNSNFDNNYNTQLEQTFHLNPEAKKKIRSWSQNATNDRFEDFCDFTSSKSPENQIFHKQKSNCSQSKKTIRRSDFNKIWTCFICIWNADLISKNDRECDDDGVTLQLLLFRYNHELFVKILHIHCASHSCFCWFKCFKINYKITTEKNKIKVSSSFCLLCWYYNEHNNQMQFTLTQHIHLLIYLKIRCL